VTKLEKLASERRAQKYLCQAMQARKEVFYINGSEIGGHDWELGAQLVRDSLVVEFALRRG